MLSLQLDEKALEDVFSKELKKRLDQLENKLTFWSMKELCKQTCLSENTIKDKFFYDERFPKHKVGGKWMFPAKECEKFLLVWIKEQPNS
jgi:phage pi2 protein 07